MFRYDKGTQSGFSSPQESIFLHNTLPTGFIGLQLVVPTPKKGGAMYNVTFGMYVVEKLAESMKEADIFNQALVDEDELIAITEIEGGERVYTREINKYYV